jgi:outer membrane protein TolC
VQRADLQTELARKEFRPDLGLQYIYQNTDRKFRDYYMLTFTVTLPNRGRRRAELAEAMENRQTAAAEPTAEVQRRMAEVQDQYVIAKSSTELSWVAQHISTTTQMDASLRQLTPIPQ